MPVSENRVVPLKESTFNLHTNVSSFSATPVNVEMGGVVTQDIVQALPWGGYLARVVDIHNKWTSWKAKRTNQM